jgi:Flp pilus assembly protein TadG
LSPAIAIVFSIARIFSNFRRANSGNVAITFGLTLLPITLAVGAAVDYSFANRTKAVLDSYADAAALAAANQSAMALSASTARVWTHNLIQ